MGRFLNLIQGNNNSDKPSEKQDNLESFSIPTRSYKTKKTKKVK
jgi:hypothetical protein